MDKVFRRAAAYTFCLIIAFTPAAVNAGDINTAPQAPVQTVATQEIEVPMNDARGIEEDGVQMSAAIVSKDAQVIVFFGENYEAYKATVLAAKEVIAEGRIPLRGIILADPLTPRIVNGYQISGSQEIELYANGQLTVTIAAPTGEVKNRIKQLLLEDYYNIIRSSHTVTSESKDAKSQDNSKAPQNELME